MSTPVAQLLQGIGWLGHASFRFRGSKTIYTDPWELKGPQPPADLVLVTHSHYDHLSPGDVKKLLKPDTVVVAPPDCEAKLREAAPRLQFVAAEPGRTLHAAGLTLDVVPAYNIGKKFHPRSANWVGYRFELDGRAIYQTGDSDDTPELRATSCDLLLLPIGGTYTMSAVEAAEAARANGAAVAVPMHWGKIVGTPEDAHIFRTRLGPAAAVLDVTR